MAQLVLNGEMSESSPAGQAVTVSPEECSVYGNKQMLVTFNSTRVAMDGQQVAIVFQGMEQQETVLAKPLNGLTYSILIPAHQRPERVVLSVTISGVNASKVVHRQHFTYTAGPESFIAELLVQSVSGTPSLGSLHSFLPPLGSTSNVATFDETITKTFSGIMLPKDWTIVGYRSQIEQIATEDTLLHFSAQLGLVKLTSRLLALPGSVTAVVTRNKDGLTPADVANQQGHDVIVKLLNDFAVHQWVQLVNGQQKPSPQVMHFGGTLPKLKPKPAVDKANIIPIIQAQLSNLTTTLSTSCPSLNYGASTNGVSKEETCPDPVFQFHPGENSCPVKPKFEKKAQQPSRLNSLPNCHGSDSLMTMVTPEVKKPPSAPASTTSSPAVTKMSINVVKRGKKPTPTADKSTVAVIDDDDDLKAHCSAPDILTHKDFRKLSNESTGRVSQDRMFTESVESLSESEASSSCDDSRSSLLALCHSKIDESSSQGSETARDIGSTDITRYSTGARSSVKHSRSEQNLTKKTSKSSVNRKSVDMENTAVTDGLMYEKGASQSVPTTLNSPVENSDANVSDVNVSDVNISDVDVNFDSTDDLDDECLISKVPRYKNRPRSADFSKAPERRGMMQVEVFTSSGSSLRKVHSISTLDDIRVSKLPAGTKRTLSGSVVRQPKHRYRHQPREFAEASIAEMDTSPLSPRDSADYPLLSTPRGSIIQTGLPLSPLATNNVILREGSRKRSISPPLSVPGPDEEPTQYEMIQPSIKDIVRKPLTSIDPEIESSVDRVGGQRQQVGGKQTGKKGLARAETVMGDQDSSHRMFGIFRGKAKDKDKKKGKGAGTSKSMKVTTGIPRPNSASSDYPLADGEAGVSAELSNVFPEKQVNVRSSRSNIRSVVVTDSVAGLPPRMAPTENKPISESHRTGISVSSSRILPPVSDAVEQPKKNISSSDLGHSPGDTVSSGKSDSPFDASEAVVFTAKSDMLEGSVEEEDTLSNVLEDPMPAYPELIPDHKMAVWSETVSKKVFQSLNKQQRDRQEVIYELIQTENHILIAIQILLMVYKKGFKETLKVPDDIVEQMFAHLEPLLQLTREFYGKLKQRQDEAHDRVVSCIGDIILDHFTGENGSRLASAYGAFCIQQTQALALFREQNKNKRFHKLCMLWSASDVCRRRNYPEFITLLSQRITKYPNLLKRLYTKTSSKHADHALLASAVEHSSKVASEVNQIVDKYSLHKQLLDIQSNLEIHLPRSAKLDDAARKEIRSLNLMANGRTMVKRDVTTWVGSQHAQENVVIVLVTDMLVLLVLRDQKYNLASLPLHKPPVMKLFDLHVRVNEASIKSSKRELFLIEKGVRPEFYKLQWDSEKLLHEWHQLLSSQIEYCKANNLRCPRFGNALTEELREGIQQDGKESRLSSVKKREKKSKGNKRDKYMSMYQDTMDLTKILLTPSPSMQDLSLGYQQPVPQRHESAVSIPMKATSASPTTSAHRLRSNTVISIKPQPITAIDGGEIVSKKPGRATKGGKPVERSHTFFGREDKKDRRMQHQQSQKSGTVEDVVDGVERTMNKQVECIRKLLEVLDGFKEIIEEQDSTIYNLQEELSVLQMARRDDSDTPPARMDNNGTPPVDEWTSKTEPDLLRPEPSFSEQIFSGLSLDNLHMTVNADQQDSKAVARVDST